MIKRKECNEDGCSLPRWARGKCKIHDKSKASINKNRSATPKKKKSTGEAIVFKMIWEEREHVSFISGIHLGDEAKAHFFAHVISKGKEDKLRLVKENIVFLSMEEHHLLDHGHQEQRDKYTEEMKSKGVTVDWSLIDKRKDNIIKKYKL